MALMPLSKSHPARLAALKLAALALCCALGLAVLLRAAPAWADPPHARGVGAMAMKPVVCRLVDKAKGKEGQALASAVEMQALEMHGHNYGLVGLLPGEPPIACYRSLTDPSTLPMGAR